MNPNLIDYKWRTFSELPEMEHVILETPFPNHRFHAIGVGEITPAPGPSAVLMAVSNAIGVRMHDYPLTPDKVLRALGKIANLVDGGVVFEHLVLAVCAQGLGTCWIGVFDVIKKDFGIPEPWRVVALSPLDYSAQDPPPRPRKPLREMVFAGSWDRARDLLNGEGRKGKNLRGE